jgi:filamentous hemagglutinin family protein
MKIDTTPLNVSLLAFAFVTATHAWANPVGATVAGGSATITNTGATLTITNSPNTIINWQGFSISAGETTRFVQQSSTSAVLNRVTTQSASSILGSLQSNGRVFLVNPNGILFGSGAQVNTASFTATTLNISDSAFLSGNTATSGAGSTLSFDGLMTVNGSLTVGVNGITTDGTLSFSGKDVIFDGGAMTVNGTISTGGNLSLDARNIVTPISSTVLVSNESRVYVASPNAVTVQTTPKSVLSWRAFSIPASEVSKFAQPSNSSVALNQVTVPSPSIAMAGIQQFRGAAFPAIPNGNLSAAIIPVRAVSVGVNLQKREPMF